MANKETPATTSGNNANSTSAQNNNTSSTNAGGSSNTSFANDPVISRLINANRHLYGETQAEKSQRASGNISPQQQAYIQSVKDQKNIARYNEIINYLNSGKLSSTQTKSYLEEANIFANGDNGYELTEYDEKTGTAKYSDQSWSSVWGDLASILEQDLHRQQGVELLDERDRIVSNGDVLKKRQEYANNVMRSTSAAMNTYGEGWSGYAGQQKRNDTYTSLYNKLGNEIKDNEAALTDIENRIFDFFAPQEVKDARALLESGVSGTGFSSSNIRENIMNAIGKQDKGVEAQRIVDEWMQSFGMNQAYFNRADRAVGAARSSFYGIESGLEGAGSLIGKALNSADWEGAGGSVGVKSEQQIAAEKQQKADEKLRIGLPEGQATEDYLAWYSEESAKFNDPNYAFENSWDAFQQENAQRLEALLNPEIEALGKRISYLETRIENNSKASDIGANSETLRQAQEDAKTVRELRKQQQDSEDRLLEAQGLRDKTSLRYKLATDYQNDIFAKVDARVDELDAKSQAEILKAKERATSYGKILLDMEKTGLEMGFDMAAGMLTGGSSLVPMFLRVMGNESAAARRDGATLDQQLKYGVTKAAIELATEKLFGAFDKIGYGKGIANEMSERIVAKLAETDLGRSLVRAIISAVEEGAEEGLADILAPIADQMYKDETWRESWNRETENFWYDVLLGAAMGGLGTVTGVVTGQNKAANQELRRSEASQSFQNVADYETALEQYNDKVDSRTRELVKYEGMTEEAAKAQAVEEIGESPQEQKLSAGAIAQEKLTALKMMEQLAGENANLEEVDNDIKLTQEEFDSALQQGLVEKADAAKYLATEEAGEIEEAPAATGDGVQSRLSTKDNKTRKVDENGNPLNRMRKLTERMARIAEKLGYGNKTNQSDAYKTATGMTPEEVDAQNNAASVEAMQEAGAQPKGGDASPYNLDNYDQAGINKLWKDRKMTSGQYAEAMVQKGFWSEATARNFLSLVRREGDRLGLNTAEERKRNLGNYTIGPNNAQNAPQGQAASEDTPAPAETEKTVKPTVESSEQGAEAVTKPQESGTIDDEKKVTVSVSDPTGKGKALEDIIYAYEKNEIAREDAIRQLAELFPENAHEAEKMLDFYTGANAPVDTRAQEQAEQERAIEEAVARIKAQQNAGQESTNEQKNGTIKGKKGSVKDGIERNYEVAGEETLRGEGVPASTDEGLGQDIGSNQSGKGAVETRAEKLNESAKKRLDDTVKEKYPKAKTLPYSEHSTVLREFEDKVDRPISIVSGTKSELDGTSFGRAGLGDNSFGILARADDSLGETLFHENDHLAIEAWEEKNDRVFLAEQRLKGALVDSKILTEDQFKECLASMMIRYVDEFSGGKYDTSEFADIYENSGLLSVYNYLEKKIPSSDFDTFKAIVSDELLHEFVSASTVLYGDIALQHIKFTDAVKAVRRMLVDNDVYDKHFFDNVDNLIQQLNEEGLRLYAEANGYSEIRMPSVSYSRSGVVSGSGVVGKQSDSAAMSKQTFRGEEKRVRDSGGTTYVSKTNDERSRIADHQLRDENFDNEINRLLNKDERWDDQDVVTAERAMYKMIRAIRDYQLGNSRKMKKSGFDALIKRYNDLTTRHINEKSKAGQELQATYQFTPEELVMNRMAKTFLGFAKDGTFAGNTNLAVNAKIYAAAEDAANRITKAAEAKDAKALAQICKDISDIRGVKNMFGAASGFASKVENEILNAIAQQENGVEALQTLALGNLNAICDDVQPYKVVNAAKTIRVMNMLSNMSTIINNITNNIASGLTSTNAVSQGASLLASKAFENITGQTVLTPAAKGWVANKEIRNAEMEALKMATLVQLYGVNQENGKLEIQGDKGLFNPNANAFEQTMAMYKFFIGMGVEATDQVKSEGLMKAMNIGIDKALAKGKITEKQAEAMRQEAKHEVNRLLYKDDNRLSGFIQGVRNKLNKAKSWGNDDIGTIGLGDIAMAFAKVPANVVRARLYATPEGCLVQLAQYTKGVMKAKRMHSETMARQIMESHATELANLRAELQKAYDLEVKEVSRETKDTKIAEIKSKIAALNRECWNEAREKCSGGVYNKLIKMRDNYGSNLDFDDCVQRCKYSDATEMSQFEAATYSRKIGKAATSAGMVALGAILRGLGALRDFDQEPDDELRKMYKQKGYSGLMFNWSAIGRKDHEWRDGDIILDADFLEVVAMPLAIGATAREAAMNVEGKGKTKAFVTEAGASGLSKTFEAVGDIPGMADAVNLYNAITSQFNTDNAAKGNRVFNAGVQYLANTLPSFFIPNAYTQLGAGLDNTVRDTYTTDNIWQQAGNIMLNKTAFFRRKIPASVDMWGEERQYGENKFWGVVNKTLLPGDRIKYRQNKYESEIIRLTKEGYKGATPKLSVSGSFEVDGETYEMDADEKRAYRQNRNSEQAEVYQQFMDSPEYALLSDDQKVAVLKDLKMDCERDAKQAMLNDRGLDVEVTRAKWETELPTTKDQITYLSMKQLAGAAWDSEENRVSDYAAMDSFLKDHYGDMTKEMRDILDGSMSQLDKMYDARKVGISSEMWQKAYDIYRQYNSDEGQAAVDGGFKDWEATEMWTKMEKATGASNAQMNWFEENMGLMRHMRVDPEHYQDLTDKLGWSREASSNLTRAMSELQPSNGNKTVSYKQRLRCIAESKGTTDDQKWEAFYEYCPSSYTNIIKGMTNLRNRGYAYEQALKTYKSGKNSMWWVYEGE